MRRAILALALFTLCAASPARADLRHYVVAPPVAEEKKAGGEAAAPSKNFVVTPVQDCFSRLKPGEANEVRRDFESPWLECQRRLRAREEEAARKDAAAGESKDKDGKDRDVKAGEPPAGKPSAQKP